MKKRLFVAAGLMTAAFALTACGSKKAAETTAATTAAETSTAAETTTAAEESTAAAETTAAEESAAAAETTAAETETSAEEKKDETKASEAAKETAAETAAKVSAKSVSEIYQQVSGSLPSMVKVDADYMSNYYGIDAGSLSEYVFAIAEDPTKADTVIIIHAKDSAAAQTVAAQLDQVKQQKAQELENYNPEQYQVVVNSAVKTAGDYAYLVMSGNAAGISSVIAQNLG